MKNKRQEKILELIAKYEIETHDDMISRLRDDGYNVTQATISRDMRELKLTKVLTSRGTYKYTVNNSRHHANNVKFNNAVVDSIVSVDYAGNNIVLKTYPGMAQAIAAAIDGIDDDSVLGCVAGDDAIIVVTRDIESAERVGVDLRRLIRENN